LLSNEKQTEMTVAIVTDSTADIDSSEAERRAITVVPLLVSIGSETFRDGRDLSAADFFQRLATSTALPRTSAPSPGAFLEAFQQVGKDAESILCVTISSSLSGTFNAALVARGHFAEPARIRVLDSRAATAAAATGVLAAAQAAAAGMGLDDVAAVASGVFERQKILVGLETLEYLHRGGRIGRATAFLGGLLSVKPLLTLERGELAPLERVRSRRRMLERLAQFALSFPQPEIIRIAHAAAASEANELAQCIRAQRPATEIDVAWIGPAVGVHAGPGAVGIAVVPEAVT
jgi:DegV family protein with EDD domain